MHDPADERKSIVFLHIPKTGGTSLHSILTAQLAPSGICPERFDNLQRFSPEELRGFCLYSGHFSWSSLSRIPGPTQIVTLLREPKARLVSLYNFWRSHKWEHVERNNLTGVRLAKTLDLRDFLRHDSIHVRAAFENALARQIIGNDIFGEGGGLRLSEDEFQQRTRSRLAMLAAIGFTESMDQDIPYILGKLGLDRGIAVPRLNSFKDLRSAPGMEEIAVQDITPDIDAELNRLTALDTRIYNTAREFMPSSTDPSASVPP